MLKQSIFSKDRIFEYRSVSRGAVCLYCAQMKRDVFPAADTVAPCSTVRTSMQHGVFLTHWHGIAPCLKPADFERRACLAERHPIGSEATTKTLSVDPARATANAVAGTAFLSPAEPEKTLLEEAPIVAIRAVMHLGNRGEARRSVLLSLGTDGTQRSKRLRRCFKTQTTRSLTTVCLNKVCVRAASARTNIYHLPFSDELQGISSVSLIIFKLSWLIRWRGIKSLPSPFV